MKTIRTLSKDKGLYSSVNAKLIIIKPNWEFFRSQNSYLHKEKNQ